MKTENLPIKTQQRLKVIADMEAKAEKASGTFNPMEAKRLAGEIATESVSIMKELVIILGELEAAHEASHL